MNAVRVLIEQVEGRPGVAADSEEGQRIVIVRCVHSSDSPHEHLSADMEPEAAAAAGGDPEAA